MSDRLKDGRWFLVPGLEQGVRDLVREELDELTRSLGELRLALNAARQERDALKTRVRELEAEGG
uniref:Uncharacterized protein n=1 Tax=viral metagenome TaxID=1070528 RepID=A0A6M3KPM2_9ZZZZ